MLCFIFPEPLKKGVYDLRGQPALLRFARNACLSVFILGKPRSSHGGPLKVRPGQTHARAPSACVSPAAAWWLQGVRAPALPRFYGCRTLLRPSPIGGGQPRRRVGRSLTRRCLRHRKGSRHEPARPSPPRPRPAHSCFTGSRASRESESCRALPVLQIARGTISRDACGVISL